MLAKRIIPCLDVRNGKVVKGINFAGVKDIGDPVEYAEKYNKQGADELVFYDITASHEDRSLFIDTVREVAKNVFVPLTVGGGISTVNGFREILRAGADKISVNSAAVKNPQLINDASFIFGSQCVVVGIDAKRTDAGNFTVCINGGRIDTGIELTQWVREIQKRGAGEICLNSIDADGTKAGFDIEMLRAVCNEAAIPVIASGGGGDLSHFTDVFAKTNASAALAASLFHFGELTVEDVKQELIRKGNINVRYR
ncbi:MAG: imidazole glycerol phosphate synthase subunit HisF [Oscillospiraceae bacterium]|jgi:cyclase|nr:imidazole glycerol phosphate synthase subunit HisF [Oscillospiraceae bacterium]